MLSVLLRNLRVDLREHILAGDQLFFYSYASISHDKLQWWLLRLDDLEGDRVPSLTMQELLDSINPGIQEHVSKLEHPFRYPWSWSENDEYTPSHDSYDACDQLCGVMRIGHWKCPDEARVRIVLMIMAIFNEPVCVWCRNGKFDVIHAVVEVLRKAEAHNGSGELSSEYRPAFHDLKHCVLLYEGLMGVVGADIMLGKNMFLALQGIFLSVLEKYEAYETTVHETKAKSAHSWSPAQFDAVLRETGAVISNNVESPRSAPHSTIARTFIEMSKLQSNDILETGVWAPDFPKRRPCPTEQRKHSQGSQVETSCSKDFNVHSAFSPGIFGAYCLCKHVKTVALMLLKTQEGCRMPLNFIVERCPRLPETVIYDFACGTNKAALGMSTEIASNVNFVIDPFHFPGHKTRTLAMHQSSYLELLRCNTESQEQRKKGIKTMEKTLRRCLDVHYIHLVILAHGYLNLKSIFMDHHDVCVFQWGSRAWIRWVRDVLFPSKM